MFFVGEKHAHGDFAMTDDMARDSSRGEIDHSLAHHTAAGRRGSDDNARSAGER